MIDSLLGEHSTDEQGNGLIGLITDGQRQHDSFRFWESLKGPRVGRLDDKTGLEGVISVSAAKGVHTLQVRGEAERDMVILRAGDRLEDTGEKRTGLADDEIDLRSRRRACPQDCNDVCHDEATSEKKPNQFCG